MTGDHNHACSICEALTPCTYNMKECLSKGVSKAIQVNKHGPFCNVCRTGIEFLRYCIILKIDHTRRLRVLEEIELKEK